MKLNPNINYIVSGLERSGTSLLMQIMDQGGFPSSYDMESRPPDTNNPKGYYELEGGKIINRLMKGEFPFEDHKGKFIKITAFGLKFLPPGNYKIVYSLRDIDEILNSMEKMAKIKDENREETKLTFLKLNEMIKSLLQKRSDTEVLFVSYNEIMKNPFEQVEIISRFLESPEADLDKMAGCVDTSLYRNRKA